MKAKQNKQNYHELKAQHRGLFHFDYQQAVNYALVNSDMPILLSAILENQEEQRWHEVRITISGQYVQPSTCILDTLLPGQSMQLDTLRLIPDLDTLQHLTEAINTTFTVSISVGEEEPEELTFPILLQPFDQWNGNHGAPQLLTSFITPNHPYVQQICRVAADLMQQWTGDSSMYAYQNDDPNEVRLQVAAVYEALRRESIAYVMPPASFAAEGQRVRMADIIRRDRLATCLDLTLLMAGCLEQLGINPIIVMMQGHAFVGAWLTEQIYNRSVGFDRERLLKLSANGVGQLVLVETTCVCQSESCSFETSFQLASNQLCDRADEFLYFIDVRHCRMENYCPLPQVLDEDGQWRIIPSAQNQESDQRVRPYDHFVVDFDDSTPANPSRFNIWERKLLDLTMANRLLDMRIGAQCIPLITLNTADLVETFSRGDSYRIFDNPTDLVADVFKCGAIDSLYYKNELASFVTSGLAEHKLYSYDDADQLDSQLKGIFRQARINLEESGATSLFLTVGLLHWQDEEEEPEKKTGCRRRRTKTDHVAPIMLLPVQLVQRQGGTGYSIVATEDPLIFNITLFELLKQRFGIDMTNVLNLYSLDLGEDDKATDQGISFTIKQALAALRLALADRPGWNVHEECTLGLFSFQKFVMWNDIHQYADQLQASPVVKSLIENRLVFDDVPDADSRVLDNTKEPLDFALPIDVDSSQLEAIADAGQGKSFLLYGPPGTGKSQTITNMVSNALYHGQRVIFVAQKKAALDVVQNRLELVGLAPFCLELHSNKATKSHLLHQFDQTLQLAQAQSESPDFEKVSDSLFARRKELIGYMESLHRKQQDGRSLYDYIQGYMSIEGDEVPVTLDLARRMDEASLDKVCEDLEVLDAVFRLTGHPANHPLLGLEPHTSSPDQIQTLFSLLGQLADRVGNRGYSYPPDQSLLDKYPADIAQRYNEVESSLFLMRSYNRKKMLQQLRAKDVTLRWEDIPSICQGMLQVHDIQTLIDGIDQLANVNWPADDHDLVNSIHQWSENRLLVKSWCQWSLRRRELAERGLMPVIDWMIRTGANGSAAASAFRKGVYHKLAEQLITTDPQLCLFNGMIFQEAISRYRTLAKEFKQLTKDELIIRLTSRVRKLLEPTQSPTVKSELTFLKRNIANHGRGVSIRHIISRIQHILPDLCPCLLMSPISVAQYLPLNTGSELADLVIFDEASQIPTSEAVGAIARGKSVVIVGDPRQMPPTTFFQANAVGDDEAEYDDMDSILDDCIALSMPSHYLTWHYRSRHESLISFSNANFYDGRLKTFPSADDRASHVEFIPIEGVYDKGASRSNRIEAETIVDEILRHYQDPSTANLSLGVISFSKVQQNLIEDILQERLNGHPALAKQLNASEEPLFIKNLENVQGDERDVILFSVGYGPDKDGNVSMNFGPLNISGGERRLNVAVSRARQRMKVFSSMHSEHIDLSRTKALGVVGLKNFLYYAEHGQQPEFASQQPDKAITGGLPALIAEQLRAKGYQVDTYVGRSSFRVDLAIVDPNDPEHYLVGILCDGKNYYATPTAREREIVQPSVLKGLGWNLERVWSVDWLEDSESVINRLTSKLEAYA